MHWVIDAECHIAPVVLSNYGADLIRGLRDGDLWRLSFSVRLPGYHGRTAFQSCRAATDDGTNALILNTWFARFDRRVCTVSRPQFDPIPTRLLLLAGVFASTIRPASLADISRPPRPQFMVATRQIYRSYIANLRDEPSQAGEAREGEALCGRNGTDEEANAGLQTASSCTLSVRLARRPKPIQMNHNRRTRSTVTILQGRIAAIGSFFGALFMLYMARVPVDGITPGLTCSKSNPASPRHACLSGNNVCQAWRLRARILSVLQTWIRRSRKVPADGWPNGSCRCAC